MNPKLRKKARLIQPSTKDIIKAARKKSREEEIATYGKPMNYQKVAISKKVYSRKGKKSNDC
jgi:uncharacterized metal-binding protein